MSEAYDAIAARHYAAYRPHLHGLILERVLSADEAFVTGLDVGCGTGYSSVALAAYCERVVGIDPSPSMLSHATAHERVTYCSGAGERVPLADRSVGVATFAGSLFYTDAAATSAELRRVCPEGAIVLVYDFEVILAELLALYGIDAPEIAPAYDHRASFSGATGLSEIAAGSDRVGVKATASEVAHILLADPHGFHHLAEWYQESDPYLALTRELESIHGRVPIEAEIYYSRYVVGSPPGLTRSGSIRG